MARLNTLAALVSLFGLLSGCSNLSGPPLHSSINAAGERVDLRSHLVKGKLNVVAFYADW